MSSISNSSILCFKQLGTVPSVPITIGITVTFIFHRLLSLLLLFACKFYASSTLCRGSCACVAWDLRSYVLYLPVTSVQDQLYSLSLTPSAETTGQPTKILTTGSQPRTRHLKYIRKGKKAKSTWKRTGYCSLLNPALPICDTQTFSWLWVGFGWLE